VAHSSLVTTDIGTTFFIFLSVYLLWEYLNRPTWTFLIATGVCTGIALLAKFSALILVPIVACIIALIVLLYRPSQLLPATKNAPRRAHGAVEAATLLGVIVLLAALMIPAGYGFRGFEPWFTGLSQFLAVSQQGRPGFFLGHYSDQGWWSYFPVAFVIKTPVGTLLMIAGSLMFWRFGSALQPRELIFLLLPPALVFLVMAQAKINIGLRHILPVYPFLFVLASRVATIHLRRRWVTTLMFALPLVFVVASVLRVAPHQLAYFNELVGGPEQGYRYLSDSNIDWGQDLQGVKMYMDAEHLPIIYLSYFGTAPPSYYGIRYHYVPGTWPLEWPPPADKVPAQAPRKLLAISVTNLQDVSRPHDPLFRWLEEREPVKKIGYSIFVYDITHDARGLAHLKEVYSKAGIEDLR
jgi:hypothetical protein